MSEAPIGGTELMYGELMKRLPQDIKDKYSIVNYISYASTDKPIIYWNQLSYDQPAVQFLQNSDNIEQIKHFVFVSHWQSEQYRKIFNIPGYKASVIKNAHLGIPDTHPNNRTGKIKICYTSTPWRGLDILLSAWEQISVENCELHIFSSTKIYGKDFHDSQDDIYTPLYEKCNNLPNVIYRGFMDNHLLRNELPTFDILAYPSTFEETSCIAAIEALSAGIRVITSNLGALPETTEGWATLYPYMMNEKLHAAHFGKLLREEINNIRTSDKIELLNTQRTIYGSRWNWDSRIQEWIQLFNTLGD